MSAEGLRQLLIDVAADAIGYRRPTEGLIGSGLERMLAFHRAAEVVDALLDGPLRETLRLARIGAWVETNLPYNFNTNPAGRGSVTSYRDGALAAGAPVESPQGDAQ